MGLDFNGYFALGAAYRGPEWLVGELAREPPSIRECVAAYGRYWSPKEWQLESPTKMYGPGGFGITIGDRALEVYHCIKFAHFTFDPDHRARLRAACFAIANLVGSPRAIYTHELMPGASLYDEVDLDRRGADLDRVESELRAAVGPPATTIAELAAAEDFGARRWYIDDFADLRTAR